jgi:2-polyprenyl-3-methyl-5-hydroxy-6-metoxy-1,4-benzoquinol methylase
MEIRTLQRPLCPLCGSQGDLLYKDLEDRLFNAPGKWSLRRCANAECGLCWLDPVAVEADIQFLYKSYYTHEESASLLGFRAKARAFLIKVYEFAKFLPLSALRLNQEKRSFANMFLENLRPGRILDVGCGSGLFLYRMHQLGWSVTGLDFDDKAIAYAKAQYSKHGFELFQTDLAGARFPDNSFDAVTMNHVIEHVPEPVKFLAEVKRVLKPGGRLVAVTPNVQSLGHMLFQDCWSGLEPPRHLQIFSLQALENCARQASFQTVEVKSSAANADVVIGGSFGIREAKKSMTTSRALNEINMMRALRSSFIQYREALLLRKELNRGEEAVLICHK